MRRSYVFMPRTGARLRRRRIRNWIYLLLGYAMGLLTVPFLRTIQPVNHDEFLDGLIPEFVGITFTVLILERLSLRRERITTLEQLARRVHSRHNATALAAIEELRVLGHLEDGTLVGQELRGSNWQDANLYQADLRRCDLTNANLINADLVEANLRDAIATDGQFASTQTMYGATLPDGNRYDGRYNLAGDFALARRRRIDIGSPEEMADFYGVPLEIYLRGQAWARRHLLEVAGRQPEDNYDYDYYTG